MIEGIPGVPVELPHVLGSDGAGVVDRLGPGVEGPPIGSNVLLNPGIWDGTCAACVQGNEALCRQYRILGEHTQGSLTDFVVLPARNVHPIPDGLTFAEAAAIPLVFQTAWRALLTIGALQPGETVAVIGAGGGVATAAIQIARWRGARVVVVSRSADKRARAEKLGAEGSVPIPEDGAFDKALWAWSDRKGVDLIFDSAGQRTIPRSLRSLARGGRIVVIGATTGPMAEIDLRTLFWRSASIRGSTMAGRSDFEAVLAAFQGGKLRPVIDRSYPFENAAGAWERFTSGDVFGKVVVERNGPG
ncbi:MAG: zinc-binding dehydrogenase [Thermoplasmata archaeon]|nr:zinc-binding dehydrogenase [Thermoplasmata archaeon]